MFTIRNAVRDDAVAITAFQIAMARETEGIDLDPPTVAKGVDAVFGDAAKGAYRVAEEDGKLLGVMLTIPEWSDWRNGDVVWIHSTYVVPEARRRGIFREFYRTMKRGVEASDALKGLRLFVDKKNARAREVYEAMGMNRDHYELYEWLQP